MTSSRPFHSHTDLAKHTSVPVGAAISINLYRACPYGSSRHVAEVRWQHQRLAWWHWVGSVGHGEYEPVDRVGAALRLRTPAPAHRTARDRRSAPPHDGAATAPRITGAVDFGRPVDLSHSSMTDNLGTPASGRCHPSRTTSPSHSPQPGTATGCG
jgi:hypothetical protein